MSEELELMLAERAIQRVLTSYPVASTGSSAAMIGGASGNGCAPTIGAALTVRVPAAASPTPTFEVFAPPMTSSTAFSMSRRGFPPR